MQKKSPLKKPLLQRKQGQTPIGMPNGQGDVYEDAELDDAHDPGAYLGDQYIMLGDEYPEGPW
jgi:hypothetical protein